MVETLGPQTLKYIPNALEVLLHPGCDVADMIEVVAVVNQLTNGFTNSLEELMERVLPVLVAEIHSKLGESWDWSGALCLPTKGDVQKGALVEESREKGDLQKAYYSLLHVTVSSKLDGVVLKLPEATLKVILSALIEGASSHMDPAVRKSCIQVLLELVDGWADRISTDQGLLWFVMERIGGDVCIQGILRGGLDPKDAATVAFLTEVGGMLKLIRDKCGYEFLVHLNGTVFPKMGLPPEFQTELVNRIQVADPKETKNFMKAALMRLSR
ncbi:hypothetical protein BSKO_07262 [Bryopsis sp. KO-2023]|nr:hypothetical protein BSKO_07262 [Bryopsis sp. KO-2023]